MRILLTGGGTGGHIFPLIAVVQAARRLAEKEKIEKIRFVFIGPKIENRYWQWLIQKEGIKVVSILAGKIRRYGSILNVIDFFKLPFSILSALWHVFWNMPDVVFSKGGYGSFPVVLASRFYRVPVFIHESDARAGLANRKLSRYAKKVFVGFESAKEDFPKKEVIVSGNPVRDGLTSGNTDKARFVFHILQRAKPVILVMGGSQGASTINDLILNSLDVLLPEFEIIHLTGADRYERTVMEVQLQLGKMETAGYHPFPFLTDEMPMAYAIADVVVSRAGAAAIYEIAACSKPSILIPLEGSAQDHQKANAYQYAQTGAAIVLEDFNLTPNLLLANLEKVLQPPVREKMSKAAGEFIKVDAAAIIAEELIYSVRKPS